MAEQWRPKRRDMVVLVSLQAIMFVLYTIFVRYDNSALPKKDDGSDEGTHHEEPLAKYPVFQDVHVMIFVGFGFLMTFLKRYGYGAVGFTLLFAAFLIQWAMLYRGFLHIGDSSKIPITMESLLEADLTAAATLISMGALLGKTSPLQLVIMGIVSVVVGVSNEYLGNEVLKAPDAGASMYVHVFGAYFGLAASFVLGHGKTIRKGEGNENEGATYTSDLFAMIGTVFLWLFWPSFNGALVDGDQQHRAVINTYLSLAACCVTSYVISALVHKETKFDMVHIQNATLAGGVAIGTSADLIIQPGGAIAVGMVAAILSVLGYKFLQPALLNRIGLHDTCGVNNLHGMPGILAGIVGAIMAALATPEEYLSSLGNIYPGRSGGDSRSAVTQAGYQLLALGITFVISLVSGAITGFILRIPQLDRLPRDKLFSDEHYWELPEEHVQDTHENTDKNNENKSEMGFQDSLGHI